MSAIDILLTAVTEEEQLEKFLDTLEGLGLKARSWRPAGALRTILRVVAGTYAGFTVLALGFVRAGFLETAEKGWLTDLAKNVYDVERIPGTFATGKVTLTNTGGGIYTLAPHELRLTAPSNGGKAYENVAEVNLGPGASITIDIRAVELGSASNAAPGAVTELETVLPSVSASNATAIIGRDEEADPELRARCIAKLGTISGKGPRGAYQYAARSARREDGSYVDVNRVRVSEASSTGTVTTTVASASGAPADEDLEAIRESVEFWARPDSVTAIVQAATELPVERSILVWARKVEGLSADALKSLVNTKVIALERDYPIGGIRKPPFTNAYFYADGLGGAVQAAHPAIFDVDIGGGDVLMASSDVVKLTWTVNVRFVEVSS